MSVNISVQQTGYEPISAQDTPADDRTCLKLEEYFANNDTSFGIDVAFCCDSDTVKLPSIKNIC